MGIAFTETGMDSRDQVVLPIYANHPLGLPLVRSFAFLVCSVVPPSAQFFLLSMDINML